MKHECYWDETRGCGRVRFVGEIGEGEVAELMAKIESVFGDGDSRLLLVDNRESPMLVSRSVRRAFEEHAVGFRFDRLALVGSTHLNRMVGRIVLGLMGRLSEANFFVTEEEALDWLFADRARARQG